MNNSEYWKLRFEQLEAAQNEQGAALVSEIEKQYKETLRQLEGQIARWYQRFADNNGITLAEARKWIIDKDFQEFKWDVKDYIKYGQDNALTGSWIKELENASAKFHISKLEALKIHTQQSLEVMFSKQLETVTGTMGDLFESSYYHTAYELQKGFNIGWDITGLDQPKIEKVLTKPWAADGKNFSERIWGNKQKLISEVHGELTQNIMLGADPQKAIDSLAKKMKTSRYNAGRLIMTEEAYFSSAAQRDCFNELNVEQYEIVATLDSHTSDICRSLDGKVFPMKDYQPGVTAPPFHVYCRSTTVPYFDEDFGDIGERAARDEETGKTYYISDDMNYQDWKETFVDCGDKSSLDKLDFSDESGIIDLYSKDNISVVKSRQIPKSTTKKVEEAAVTVSADFSVLKDSVDSIEFGITDEALAHSNYNPSTGRNVIILSADAFSDEIKLLEYIRQDFRKGISYETESIESLIAHELGHAAHNALALKRANLEYNKPLSPIQEHIFANERSKIAQEIYIAAFTDETITEIFSKCKEELGSMTVGNANELIAQSFGNYYYGVNKSKIAKSIVEFFMKELS